MVDEEGRKRKFFLNGKEVDGAAVGGPAKVAKVASGFDFDPKALAATLDLAGQNTCVRLFVAGTVTHVGKTTMCLGLLSALRKAGVPASQLAYIKPATQCEAPDLLASWCKSEGVVNISGEKAPLVFYSGFTRSFLKGEQGTSASWIERIQHAVDDLARGRRVVIIDGVGFPSVGSIVGVDNADVAKACRAPVLVVGKSGVGGAVDSFNLDRCYFVSKGVPVLGAVFNLGELDGFYAWDKCVDALKMYFDQGGKRERYYGVVPIATALKGLREKISASSDQQLREFADLNASHLASYADLCGIFAAAAADPWCRAAPAPRKEAGRAAELPIPPQPSVASSRGEIEAAADSAGAKAKGGG